MNTKVSIVVPAFNEEKAIYNVVADLKDNFPECELIIVDDGSHDDTALLAEKAGAKVIYHFNNFGYGASLKTGIMNAPGKYIITCDADGQHRIEDIKKLLANEYKEYDAVIGVRSNSSYASLQRKPGKLVLKWFFN